MNGGFSCLGLIRQKYSSFDCVSDVREMVLTDVTPTLHARRPRTQLIATNSVRAKTHRWWTPEVVAKCDRQRDRQTDVRQTDVRQKHRLMPQPMGVEA